MTSSNKTFKVTVRIARSTCVKGGKARWADVSKEERSRMMRAAVRKRWKTAEGRSS
jgi:hypothetical protein